MVTCYKTQRSDSAGGGEFGSVFVTFEFNELMQTQNEDISLEMHLKLRWKFSLYIYRGRKKSLHFPSVQSVLNNNASASGALDEAADKYAQVLNRLGQEFENRFSDFDRLEPCVSHLKSFHVSVHDMHCWTAKFNLDAEQD